MIKDPFILAIKLIPINPKDGKMYFPACNLQPVMSVDVEEYLTTYQRRIIATDAMRETAVREIVNRLFQAYNCPIGWILFNDAKESREQLFYPPEVMTFDFRFKLRAQPPSLPPAPGADKWPPVIDKN